MIRVTKEIHLKSDLEEIKPEEVQDNDKQNEAQRLTLFSGKYQITLELMIYINDQ